MPVTKKKSKKKKKAPKGKKTVKSGGAVGDATSGGKHVPGSKVEGDLVVKFTFKLTKAEKIKAKNESKGKKSKDKKSKKNYFIDFSRMPCSDDLHVLANLDEVGSNKLEPRHMLSLLMLSTPVNLSIKDLGTDFFHAFTRVFQKNASLARGFKTLVFGKADDFYDGDLQQTLAYRMMCHEMACHVLNMGAVALAVELSFRDPVICNRLAGNLRLTIQESIPIIRWIAIGSFDVFFRILDIAVNNRNLLQTAMIALNGGSEYSSRSRGYELTVQGRKYSTTMAEAIMHHNYNGIGVKLVQIAKSIPEIRDIVIRALELEINGGFLFQMVSIKSPDVLEAMIELACEEPKMAEFLAKMLQKKIKFEGCRHILDFLALHNVKAFHGIVKLAVNRKDARDQVVEAYLSSPDAFKMLLKSKHPTFASLASVAEQLPEFATHMAKAVAYASQYKEGENDLYLCDVMLRWGALPEVFDVEYTVSMSLAKLNVAFAKAMVQLMITFRGTEGTYLHLLAGEAPEKFAEVVGVAAQEQPGFEGILESVRLEDSEGETALQVLCNTDREVYDSVMLTLESSKGKVISGATEAGLFARTTPCDDESEGEDKEGNDMAPGML
ncbi:MAG: hypothetical protein P1U34_11405 [Coxiellaceae bacterium]|nr:hypothetical protein [Coxiellaceae bacterium]